VVRLERRSDGAAALAALIVELRPQLCELRVLYLRVVQELLLLRIEVGELRRVCDVLRRGGRVGVRARRGGGEAAPAR